MKVWKFGILGPGKIAIRFAEAFQHVQGAAVHAVASREVDRARAFASKFGVTKFYGSYEELVADTDVDIIYVATPHAFHAQHALLCLGNRKAVLCEKPMAINLREVNAMIDAARASNVFLMEGMWSRFFPAIHKTLDLIKEGVIGRVTSVEADFGFSAPVRHESRIYDIRLGGGAQLDVGVYPLFLALLILGKPEAVEAQSKLAPTGADVTTHAVLHFKDDAKAILSSSVVSGSPIVGMVTGTLGSIRIESPWFKSQEIVCRLNSGSTTRIPLPHSGNGFEFELEHVVQCLNSNQKESELLPHAFSKMMAEVSDEIRRQGGVRYPAD